MAGAFARSIDHTRKEGATVLVWTDGSTGSSVGWASATVTVAGTTGSPIAEAQGVPAVVFATSTSQTRNLVAVVSQTMTVAAISLTASTTVPALFKTENARFIALDVTEGELIIVNQVPHRFQTIQFMDPGCAKVPYARLSIVVDQCSQAA